MSFSVVASSISSITSLCNSTFVTGDAHDDPSLLSWKDRLRFLRPSCFTVFGACAVGAFLLLRHASSRSLVWAFESRNLIDSSHPLGSEPLYPSIPGLQNVGNNCFLNAVLQALASCSVLLTFLTTKESSLSVIRRGSCAELLLTEALSELLQELSVLQSQRRVASPCRVMRALEPYAKQFDLAAQQDAAEALTHITGALHEEQLTFLKSHNSPRNAITRSVSNDMCIESSNEDTIKDNSLKFCWPMEGTIGSILTCRECGFQFSTQFQSFNDVPLSPPCLSDGNIAEGCSLEACLEQFTAPELIDNVKCSFCSHISVFRLLQQKKENVNKDLLHRIQECTFGEDCSCESFVMKAGETWTNSYVDAFKQLKFGRCPEVICCHVQRAIISNSGELSKWTGHVTFPFVLDFFPYTLASEGYTERKRHPMINMPFMTNPDELLQKFIWHKITLETETHNDRNPFNTDESTSEDTHASSFSDTEDLSSELSFESMVWKSGDSIVDKYEEAQEHLQHDVLPFSVDDSSDYYMNDPAFIPKDSDHLSLEKWEQFSAGYDEHRFKTMIGQCFERTPENNSQNIGSDTKIRNGFQQQKDDDCDTKMLYELVSVVVHDGSPGNGHYTVYRKAKVRRDNNIRNGCNGNVSKQTPNSVAMGTEPIEESKSTNEDTVNALNVGDSAYGVRYMGGKSVGVNSNFDVDYMDFTKKQNIAHIGWNSQCSDVVMESSSNPTTEDEIVLWFRASDSQVDLVTEQDVVMAEATLLFYERCSLNM